MTPNLECLIDKIALDYRCGSHVALFLDYDGTLVPIVEHPSQATLDRHTRRLLNRLARRPRVHVIIISGRSLDDLKTMVRLRRLHFSGTGGMELDLGGAHIAHPLAEQAAASMRELIFRLKEALAEFPGAWVEDKRLGCTVHYRAVAAPLLELLFVRVRSVVACCPARLGTSDGPMAVEITPDLGWNKATAVHLVLERLGAIDPVVLYAGDGANDAVAMEAVTAMGGISLGVGTHAPAAEYRLADPAGLHEVLENLDECLERGMPCRKRPPEEYLAIYGLWKPFLATTFT
jgi:trehalose 6-phosphate phosphatase